MFKYIVLVLIFLVGVVFALVIGSKYSMFIGAFLAMAAIIGIIYEGRNE
jgi:hypothetical protein